MQIIFDIAKIANNSNIANFPIVANIDKIANIAICLLYTSPSPRD